MSVFKPRAAFMPFEYPQFHEYWLKQNQAHWLHCVSSKEKVFTNNGVFTVEELYKMNVPLVVFNGTSFVESSPMIKTGHRMLFEIKTKEGYKHTVTEDHRVMTVNGWVEAKDLKTGDLLCINTEISGFGHIHDPELAFLIGHYQGDGTNSGDNTTLDVWQHEYKLIPEIERCVEVVYDKYNLKKNGYDYPTFGKEQVGSHRRLNSLKFSQMGCFVKNKIPDFLWKSNKETILVYIKGLLFTDGTIGQHKKHESIKLSQIDRLFLEDVQVLLLMFGIKSTIYTSKARDVMIRNKTYACSDLYTLEITNKKHVKYIDENINFFNHREKVFRGFLNEKKSHPMVYARFESITPVGVEDVYCISVYSDYKAWVCNGFITHNTEVNMASDINDWKLLLTDKERHLIGSILKGFTQTEIFIGNDFWNGRILKDIKKPELQMMFSTFAAFESIHANGYSYLDQSLGLDDYESFMHEPTVKAKIDRLMNTKAKTKEDVAKAIAIFSAFNEGVNLFSSFAILLNFSRFNKMKGMGQIIAWSCLDEDLHSRAGCDLFRVIINENPDMFTDDFKKDIYEAARITIDLEDKFIEKAFKDGDAEGLTLHQMKNFIRNRANLKLQELGLKSNWKNIDKQALDEMQWFTVLTMGQTQQDFFAGKESAYSKGNVDWSKAWD